MNLFSRFIAAVCRFVSLLAQSTPFMKIGAMTVLVYLAMWVFYDNAAWSGPRLNRELFLWPVTIGLIVLYWVGYERLKYEEEPVKFIAGFASAMALCALFTDSFHSTDIYGYVNRGWEQVKYGLNPYVYPVDAIEGWKDDPMFSSHWSTNPSPYAFLFVQIAKWICVLGGGNFALTVFLFKLMNLFLYAGTGWLLYKGSQKLGFERPDAVLYLFLWNPLVLVHQVANSHNDLLMGFFMVAAVYCALRGWLLWLLPLVTAAVLIKYAPVVVLPIAVFYLIKQKAWKALAGGVVLSAGLAWLSAAPYLPDLDQAPVDVIERNAFVSRGSLHAFVFNIWQELEKLSFATLHPLRETVRSILKNLLLLGFVVFYAREGLRQLKQPFDVPKLIHFFTVMLFALIAVVSLKFYPWYVAIFLPAALLLPAGNGLRLGIILLSVGQILSLTAIGQAHFLDFLLMTALPLGLAYWWVKGGRQAVQSPAFLDVVAEKAGA